MEVLEKPRIDPRIARRWVEVRREEGRRRLRWLTAAVVATVVVAVGLGLLWSPLLAVRHLEVSAAGATPGAPDVAQIERFAAVNGPMIELSTSAVRARLDADPWLGAATVTRHWPSTVAISVAERRPVAAVAVPGGWAEVDATGRVLADVPKLPSGIIPLLGAGPVPAPGGWLEHTVGAPAAPLGAPQSLIDMEATSDSADLPPLTAAGLGMIAALPPTLRSAVVSLSLSQGGRPGLSLLLSTPAVAQGTVSVQLGDGSQIGAKVAALAALAQAGYLAGAAAFDLTVPGRPAATTAAAGA